MVKIYFLSFFERNMSIILVISILGDYTTCSPGNFSFTFRTTVVFPDPVPPAIPTTAFITIFVNYKIPQNNKLH